MNKAQLIETVAIKAGVSKKEAEDVMQALINLIIERLKQNKEVTLTGFGTFSAKERHARMGVNPQNPKEKIQIPAVVVPKFKSGKTLKDALKNK
ncbi:HU family DNA-binding protein [Candidatus Parcubacteria bacterium]|jgi:DNA-binding protein HU-beta|nr:HU family DNA-binding protein [Candidatus Parcubacteria bacterium]